MKILAPLLLLACSLPVYAEIPVIGGSDDTTRRLVEIMEQAAVCAEKLIEEHSLKVPETAAEVDVLVDQVFQSECSPLNVTDHRPSANEGS